MTHVMIDTETLGTKQGNIILSIGATVFNPFANGTSERTFYKRIDLFDSLLNGFEIDQRTLEWWKNQNEDAQKELIGQPCESVSDVLGAFQIWFNKVEGEQIWCQGATFDAVLLEEYFQRAKLMLPWSFWNVRDTRTIYDICGFDYQNEKREGVYHNALHDALHQVECIQKAIQKAGIKQ